jgi:hypothetical protein
MNMEVLLIVSQPVVHLDSALRIADIEDFIFASCFLDRQDVGRVIVETHLGPGKVPIL